MSVGRHTVRVPDAKSRAYFARLPPCRPHGNAWPCVEPDYDHACEVCGALPVMCATGMCGPCTTGEAETTGGNW